MHTFKVEINGPRGFRYVPADTICPKGSYSPFGFTVNTLEDATPAWAIYMAGQVLTSKVNPDPKGFLNLIWKKAKGRTTLDFKLDANGNRIANGDGTYKGVRRSIPSSYSSGCCSWGRTAVTVRTGTMLLDNFYVLMHELAHAADENQRETKNGHGPSFWAKLSQLATAYNVEQIALNRDGDYHRGSKFMPFTLQDGGYNQEAAGLRSTEGLKDRMRTASRSLGTSLKAARKS